MSLSRIGAGLLGFALLASSLVFAGEKASVKFYDPVNVGGTSLQAGNYTLRWEGAGPNVELNVVQDSTVLAKVPARLVDVKNASPTNTTETITLPDGSRSLSRIQLRGKRFAIEMGNESAQAQPIDDKK